MADHDQSVEAIFGAALDLPLAERAAFLDQACQGAPEVRRSVEQLLLENDQLGSFLKMPLFARAPTPPPRAGDDEPTIDSVPVLASPSTPPRFEPGQTIAGRFAIVRFIARGGMGEVYEARDGYLQGVNVALKVVRPEIAASPGSAYRFEQEVILARKVAHPNLCPIYDISRCEQPAPPFLFLTMKLLRGQTLDLLLRERKALPAHEAAEVCAQMVAAVGAMHAADIIHRDLKPNNVMLEHTAAGLHVSIMDFGLARLHEAEFTMLKPGMIAGTPGYLAPELLRGQMPSKASDLFALGVVLHQVLTGERPVPSRDGLTMHATPALRSAHGPAKFIDAIESFLSEDPARRCRAFDEVLASTETRYLPAQRPWPVVTRRQFAIGAGACAGVLAGGAVWKREQLYDLMHPLPAKRFVALLTWPPTSNANMKPMVNGVIDAIANELARVEAFDHDFFVISQGNVTDVTSPAQLNAVRESLGANLVLGVSGVAGDGGLRVLLQVLEAVSARSLRSQEIRVPRDQQFSLPQRAVRVAAELLDVGKYQPKGGRNFVGTDNPEALAAFQAAEALKKEPNDTGLEQAIDKYRQALEIDPRYALAQARLSWAYLRSYTLQGKPAALSLARANCERALLLDPSLVQAHVDMAWVLELGGDTDGGIHEMEKALSLDPSNAFTVLSQAGLYAHSGQVQEAEDTYRRALKLRPNDWVAHNDFGFFLSERGKYPEALLELQQASFAAPKNALPLSNIGFVYLALGKVDEAIQNFVTSFGLQQDSGAAEGLAMAARLRHRYPDAIGYAQTAVKLDPGVSQNWLELGDAYSAAGRMTPEAVGAYTRAAEVEEEVLETQRGNGNGWMRLALCRAKTGQTAIADQVLQKALSLRANGIPSHLMKIRTLALLGRRDEALAEIRRAVGEGATAFQLQTLPDLVELRADPRFATIVGSLPSSARV